MRLFRERIESAQGPLDSYAFHRMHSSSALAPRDNSDRYPISVNIQLAARGRGERSRIPDAAAAARITGK